MGRVNATQIKKTKTPRQWLQDRIAALDPDVGASANNDPADNNAVDNNAVDNNAVDNNAVDNNAVDNNAVPYLNFTQYGFINVGDVSVSLPTTTNGTVVDEPLADAVPDLVAV